MTIAAGMTDDAIKQNIRQLQGWIKRNPVLASNAFRSENRDLAELVDERDRRAGRRRASIYMLWPQDGKFLVILRPLWRVEQVWNDEGYARAYVDHYNEQADAWLLVDEGKETPAVTAFLNGWRDYPVQEYEVICGGHVYTFPHNMKGELDAIQMFNRQVKDQQSLSFIRAGVGNRPVTLRLVVIVQRLAGDERRVLGEPKVWSPETVS